MPTRNTLLALREPSEAELEDYYQVGHKEGYAEAIQEVAGALGLDDEYRASPAPERNQPDPASMLAKIVEHVELLDWRASTSSPEARDASAELMKLADALGSIAVLADEIAGSIRSNCRRVLDDLDRPVASSGKALTGKAPHV